MIRLILAVAFAVLTAALGAFLALNPGRATFEFLGTRMEMPFVVAAGGTILFAFMLLVVVGHLHAVDLAGQGESLSVPPPP